MSSDPIGKEGWITILLERPLLQCTYYVFAFTVYSLLTSLSVYSLLTSLVGDSQGVL